MSNECRMEDSLPITHYSSLALAARTKMRRSAGQANAPDQMAAANAWLSGATVHPEFVLILSFAAGAVDIVADTGTSFIDSSVQDRDNSTAEPAGFLGSQRQTQTSRM